MKILKKAFGNVSNLKISSNPQNSENECCFDFNMMEALKEKLDEYEKNPTFASFMRTIWDNIKDDPVLNSLKTEEDKIVMYSYVGFIAKEIYEQLENGFITNVLNNHEEELVAWKARLDDDTEFVISTNKEENINNELIKKVEEITGHKVVSPFRKMSDEEKKRLHEKVAEKFEEGLK